MSGFIVKLQIDASTVIGNRVMQTMNDSRNDIYCVFFVLPGPSQSLKAEEKCPPIVAHGCRSSEAAFVFWFFFGGINLKKTIFKVKCQNIELKYTIYVSSM